MHPKKMRHIEIKQFGGPENLKLSYAAIPEIQAYEVLIRVVAAGVNRSDILQRQGRYSSPVAKPPILGLEVSGFVVSVGDHVTKYAVHDQVCALVNGGGGYAEYVAVPETQCLPKPKKLDFIEAAALPETLFTVWFNLFDTHPLLSHQTLLVHGGSSGIGTIAIQLAKAFDITTYTTVGTDAKCEFCEKMGADMVVNYKKKDFVVELNRKTAGKGVDVILDMVAGSYVQKNIKIAAQNGRIIIIGLLGGSSVEMDCSQILFKRLVLTGSILSSQPLQIKARIAEALQKIVWPLIENGNIKPIIYETFPISRVSDAHILMESSQHIGKIILSFMKKTSGSLGGAS